MTTAAWILTAGVLPLCGALVVSRWAYRLARPASRGTHRECIDPTRYVKDPAASGVGFEVWHLDGIDWYNAPPPPRKHTCWAQTKGWVDLHQIFRCACGAASYDGRYWMERNQRNSSKNTGEAAQGGLDASPDKDSEGGLQPPARSLGDGHPSGLRGLEPAGEAQAGGFQDPPPPLPLGGGSSRAD